MTPLVLFWSGVNLARWVHALLLLQNTAWQKRRLGPYCMSCQAAPKWPYRAELASRLQPPGAVWALISSDLASKGRSVSGLAAYIDSTALTYMETCSLFTLGEGRWNEGCGTKCHAVGVYPSSTTDGAVSDGRVCALGRSGCVYTAHRWWQFVV